ncbi:hypothetical protein ACHAWF_016624 [Thalassiosira exigua]
MTRTDPGPRLELDLFAPPGPLGLRCAVVPEGGAVVVAEVRPESVLLEFVRAGDRVVAVDGKEVTAASDLSYREQWGRVVRVARAAEEGTGSVEEGAEAAVAAAGGTTSSGTSGEGVGEASSVDCVKAAVDASVNSPEKVARKKSTTKDAPPKAMESKAPKAAERKEAKSAHDRKWLENVNLLRPCIQENGTMDYSSLDEDAQKRMRNFVASQRTNYRKREKNEPGAMTDERVKILSEAGFDFGRAAKQKLSKDVPVERKDDKSSHDRKWLENDAQKRMQNFVANQRTSYRKREKNEPGAMTDERFRILSEARFDFGRAAKKVTEKTSENVSEEPNNVKSAPDDREWLQKANLLRACIKEDGKMDYSSLNEDAQKRMQSFVRGQRHSYRQREKNEPGAMTDERFRILSEAGFDFTPAAKKVTPKKSKDTSAKRNSVKSASDDREWLEKVNLLRPCIKEDGTMDYSSLDEDAQKRMQSFVRGQRHSYRQRENNASGAMTDERIRILSEAGFDFTPSKTKSNRFGEGSGKKKSKESKKDREKKTQAAKSPKSKSSGNAKSPKSASVASLKDEGSEDILAGRRSPKSASKTPIKEAKTTPKSASTTSSPTPAGARKKSGKSMYIDMAHDALVSLKDRTGSSVPAISKWIYANSEHVNLADLASQKLFKKRLRAALDIGVKGGRFVVVKNSFKINADWTKEQKSKAKAKGKEAAKKKTEQKKAREKAKLHRKKDLEAKKKKAADEKKRKKMKADALKKKQKEEAEAERKRTAAEKKRKEREAAALKKKCEEEAEARRKFIERQLRKRRYPMEDSRMHGEDKEWGVKPPEHVAQRPILPCTLTCLVPPNLRDNTAQVLPGSVANASASGNGMLLGGDRGLVSDAIHVYHFFRGDVGVDDADHPIPKFSLKTLLHAVDEVSNGNAKAAKSLPPLLTHLFVTALRMLTSQPEDVDDDESNEDEVGPVESRLQDDLSKLREGLNVVSWSQVCFFYMDLMERYYSSDVLLEEDVLPGQGKLDMSYLCSKGQIEGENIGMELKVGDEPINKGHSSYLGDQTGVVAKGFSKLGSQTEPWALKADELMALLRMLTDDILAKGPDLAEDIASRGAKLHELFKAKKAAVAKYNKVKLAYEGKPSRSQKKSVVKEMKSDDKKKDQEDAEPKVESEKPFVPTATKQEFTAAEKAYNKAVEAYENGLNKFISRTEPVGFDRHHNAIYFFRHDPTMLHIEQIDPSSLPTEIKSLGPELIPFSSWHSIDTKPLFQQFLDSLDERGEREYDTIEALEVGSGLTILKRHLQSDKKENTRAAARDREKEDMKRRLENAKASCNVNGGKRSGRLAGVAQQELETLEREMVQMKKAHDEEERKEKIDRVKAVDYSLLTGLELVIDLLADQSGKVPSDDKQVMAASLANVPSSKLWMDSRVGGNGTLQILVGALLDLEDKCNNLSPWSRQDITRKAWRKKLSETSSAWVEGCALQLGPSEDMLSHDGSKADTVSTQRATKKQKVERASVTSIASIVATLKLCLKELELRVFEVSGKKISIEQADTAMENDSSDDENDEITQRRSCWKVKINALKRIPSTRYGLIRDIISAAITVARKAHLNQVAAELKVALQLLRPTARSAAISAAIKVLEKHGGYDETDDEADFDELAVAYANEPNDDDEANETEIASFLCDEVQMMRGSVGGDDFADKSDWRDSIKYCKSVSRIAVLVQVLILKADSILAQLQDGRSKLHSSLGLNTKRTARSKASIRKHDSSTPIWCNAKATDKLVKAKVRGYAWLPAHVCVPLESDVAEAMEGSGYTLIRSVGNPAMFLVREKEIVDFADDTGEEVISDGNSLIENLQESVSIANKLWRKQNPGVASPWSKKSRRRFSEEKKTD